MSTPSQHQRLMELFDAAVDLPRREAISFLDSLSTIDSALRPQLEAMLAVDQQSAVFRTSDGAAALARDLLESAAAEVPRLPDATTSVPQEIGEFEVLDRVGVGGMGSVYRARQKEPVRVVALKVLHPWLMSPAALERFRFEAQALALLTHPGIPRVYAVGAHEGLVYFAMELVEGPPLLAFATERRLGLREKVDLMARIAEAVHHAHLRGFVHRDLKPDNVRVTEDGTPRVLDFGIAAGLGEHRAEVAGTPSYMSPEQFDPDVAVDLRSDVFSLGVMLFQLLTGQLPVTVPRGKLATVQALKQTPAPRLRTVAPTLDPELEAIVARALEPRRESRYASAAELAEDLRHWLRAEPVAAVAGGRLYRFRKLVCRNRAITAVAAALGLSLVAGTVISTALFFRARAAAEKASTEAERATKTAGFLANVLSEADGDNHGGRGATIGQALDHAAEKLDKEPIDPHVDAFLRSSLSNTYVGLGEWHHAKAQALAALETWEKNHLPDDDEDLAEILRMVSEVDVETGAMAEGLAAADRALRIEEQQHGDEPNTLTSYSLHVAGIAHRYMNDFPRAIALHERAVAMEKALEARGEEAYVSEALEQYQLTLVAVGRFDQARALLDESLAHNLAKKGRDSNDTTITLTHQAYLEFQAGNLEKARALSLEANAAREKVLGPQHMRTAQGKLILAQIDLEAGRLDEAEALLDDALGVARKVFVDDPGRLGWNQAPLVQLLAARGRAEEAVALGRTSLDAVLAEYGPDTEANIETSTAYATALITAGRKDEARALLETTVALCQRLYGADRPHWRLMAERLLATLKT